MPIVDLPPTDCPVHVNAGVLAAPGGAAPWVCRCTDNKCPVPAGHGKSKHEAVVAWDQGVREWSADVETVERCDSEDHAKTDLSAHRSADPSGFYWIVPWEQRFLVKRKPRF